MSKKKDKKETNYNYPSFCDYNFWFAAFSDPRAIGACRKELAVWCKLFERYNNKNNRCLGKRS